MRSISCRRARRCGLGSNDGVFALVRTTTLAASVVFTSLLASSSWAQSAQVCQRSEAEVAVQSLTARMARERLYEDWTRQSCLSFSSLCEAGHVLISVHEKHDKVCGGDPSTFPAVDHFRIDKKTGGIEWMDVTTGDYLPFESVCAKAKCAEPAAPPTEPVGRS